jgi:predicted enzyme related to lactoylglutathione lyase
MYALRQKPRSHGGLRLALFFCCAAPALAQANQDLPAFAQAGFDLPPITTPASGEHHPGQIIWHDLETTDLARAEAFYKALFGWQIREYRTTANLYVVAVDAGRPIAGMLQRSVHEDEEKPSRWIPLLSAGDVDAAVSLARRYAGHVLADPQDQPERGRQALISDPDGLTLALENSSSGDPGEGEAATGAWTWDSLFARDPAANAVFFQQALGYRILGVPAQPGFERILLGTGDRARFSINPLPNASWPQVGAWVGFLRSADVADTVARALTLGGRVIVESQADSQGALTAILADPTGALFGVMQTPRR